MNGVRAVLSLNKWPRKSLKNYDKKITEMCLVCMHPNNKNKSYIRLEVPDLSKENSLPCPINDKISISGK